MEFLLDKMTSSVSMSAAIPLPPTADPAGIKQLAELLLVAKNPVIVTEEAGKNVAAVERLVGLAELIGAPVVETRISGYVNFPRRHPLHAGFNPAEILIDADLVLLIGAVAPWHPASATFGAETKVAVLSENPLRAELPFWGYQVDLCLMGDVQRSLGVLLQLLKERIQHGDPFRAKSVESWRRRNEERRDVWRREAEACHEQKPMDTRWVVRELNRALPPPAIVVEETITHRIAVGRYLDSLKPGSFFAGAYGGLGTGLGIALGVKEAAPERPVIAVIGDGSFNYNPVLAALGYAQEYNVPILIVLMNNHGYLSQKIGIPQYFPQGWAVKSNTYVGTSITPRPDYAGLTRLFGGYGETVEEPSEVHPSLLRGLNAVASSQLALIDMWLEPVN
jgi:acetolactate synthase-1/2/3 large subunit